MFTKGQRVLLDRSVVGHAEGYFQALKDEGTKATIRITVVRVVNGRRKSVTSYKEVPLSAVLRAAS